MSHPELTETTDGVVLAVHVQPGAGSTEVVGRHGDALKVRVAAPPTGGRATEAVVALLAEELSVKRTKVQLVAGETSRQKRFRLADVDPDDVRAAIDRLLSPAGPPHRRR